MLLCTVIGTVFCVFLPRQVMQLSLFVYMFVCVCLCVSLTNFLNNSTWGRISMKFSGSSAYKTDMN